MRRFSPDASASPSNAGQIDRRPSPEIWIAAATYTAAVIVAKLTFSRTGWSVRDAQAFHFPIINHFLDQGFNADYPQLVAMLPGMHVFIAAVAKVAGLRHLEWDGMGAFLIQTSLGLAFLASNLLIYRQRKIETGSSWPFLVMMLCSNVPFYSWLWPATDLGALTAFTTMIIVLAAYDRPSVLSAILFAACVLVAGLFRQNYTALGVVYGLYYFINCADCRGRLFAKLCLLALLPVTAGLCGVGAAVWLWGGLTPSSEQWHGSATSLNPATLAHLVAYTGLMCWPVALLAIQRLRPLRYSLASCLLISIGLAILVAAIVPLSYSKDFGRDGSFFWSLVGPDPVAPWRYLIIVAALTSGFFIWSSIAALNVAARRIAPEIAILLVFFVTFAVQTQAWQRYFEFNLFLCVALFFAFPRTTPRWVGWVYVGWFGLYALTIAVKGYVGGLSVL